MRDALIAGASVATSATAYTTRKMTPRLSQGTTSSRFSQLGCERVSRMMFQARRRPRAVPTRIDVNAMNEDSSRNAACTIRVLKPIARMTPICCRRSTTARALMTPSAATPTRRPKSHEALNQPVEGQTRGDGVVDDLLDRLRFEPAREERGLQLGGGVRWIDPGGEPEVVDRRLDAAGKCLDQGLLRGRDADHLQRRGVLEDADDGEPNTPSRLLVEHLDRNRVEPLLEVEAGQLEVGKDAEVPVVAARDDRAVDDGEARLLANRIPDRSFRVVAPRDVAEAERRVLRGTASRAHARGRSRRDVLHPICFASTASTDWLPTAVKSRAFTPGVRRSAAAMSSMGAVPVVPARTWKPPPKSSTSIAWTNDPFEAVPVTSVNTTRVNIASVVPVRNRAASG